MIIERLPFGMPAEIRGRGHAGFGSGSKYQELFDAISQLGPGEGLRLKCANKDAARKAQSNASHSDQDKVRGFKVITRTDPVNGKVDGEWWLYIERSAR